MLNRTALLRSTFLATALLLPAIGEAALPAPYTARYEVRRNGSVLGTATVTYKAMPDGRYELHSSTTGSMLGLSANVDERSLLGWNGEVPETISYEYRQEVPFSTRTRSIRIDAARRRVEVRDKDKHYSPPYQPGLLDRNAINIALMHDLAAGRSGDVNYQVPNKDEVETQVYRAANPERLRTALGSQRAVRVERIRESANGRTTTLWLGADRNFVPLRMLQTEPDGDSIEMLVISIR